MTGFGGDWAYGAYDRGGRRRRRHVVPPRVEPKIFTACTTMSRASSTDPATVELAKERLFAQATQYLDTYGYVGTQVRYITDPPMDVTAEVTMRLEVEMLPRDDGEWASVHAAIAEDEADRAEAQADKTAVNDRLDALASSAAVWGSRSLTDACKAVESATERLGGAFTALGKTAARGVTLPRLPFDLTTAESKSTDESPVP